MAPLAVIAGFVLLVIAALILAVLGTYGVKLFKMVWIEYWQDRTDENQARRNERRDEAGARRDVKKTIGVDVEILNALNMSETDLENYGRRNAQWFIEHEDEIIREARELLGSTVKVENLRKQPGLIAASTAELRALAAAKIHVASGGLFEDRKREEQENSEIYGLRKQLREKYRFDVEETGRRWRRSYSQATQEERSTNGTQETISR